jgi:hypothetical protein
MGAENGWGGGSNYEIALRYWKPRFPKERDKRKKKETQGEG